MIPSYVDKGAFTSGTASLSVPPPASITSGQFCILAVESANQNVTDPTDWTEFTNSHQGLGTGATSNAVRMSAFYKTAGASEGNVSVADSGDHTTAMWLAFDGVDSINATAGGTQAASTSWTLPAITTTADDCLIVYLIAIDRDATSTANLDSYVCADLANITEIHDQSHATGVGGGLIIVTGEKATAGSVAAMTCTAAASEEGACVVVALAGASGGGTTFNQSLSAAITRAASLSQSVVFKQAASATITRSASISTAAVITKAISAAITRAATLATQYTEGSGETVRRWVKSVRASISSGIRSVIGGR